MLLLVLMWSHFTCSNAGWWHGGYLSFSVTDRWLLLTVLFVGFWRDSYIDGMVAWLLVPPFELTGHLSQWIYPSFLERDRMGMAQVLFGCNVCMMHLWAMDLI